MILHLYHDGDIGIEWQKGDRGRVRKPTPKEKAANEHKWGYHHLRTHFGKEFVVQDANPSEYNRDPKASYLGRRITVGMEPGKFSKEGWPCPTFYGWDLEPLSPVSRVVIVPEEAHA